MVYKIIDTNLNQCINAVVWDGINEWNPGQNKVAVQSDLFNIGDAVTLVNNEWVKA